MIGRGTGPAIYDLIFPSPRKRMLLRSVGVVSLASITLINYRARSLPAQIMLDFLYLGPVTIAAMTSLKEGLVTALAASCLRLFVNPLLFFTPRAKDYVDFIVVTGFYLLDPVIVEFLRRLAWQRQQLQHHLHITTAALLEALQLRDHYTGQHSRQVAEYARRIAAGLGLSQKYQDSLYLAGLLHDVGKIGIDDSLLNKPGRLTEEEWQTIRRHPRLSYRIIKGVTGGDGIIARAVLYHHERFDGGGYPEGLRGEAIPLEARILSVADCFDAMTTDRVYRPALGMDEALRELKRCAGSQLDPQVVEVFCRLLTAREGMPEASEATNK